MDKARKESILRDNPQADRRVIEDFEKLKAKLNKLGVSTKSTYSIEPPFGDIRASLLIKPSPRKSK